MKVFFCGYSELAGRSGDLYVKRKSNCWHINAGVNLMGHNPGFGVTCDIADGSPAYENFEEFLKETAREQSFIILNWAQRSRSPIRYLKKFGITFTKK